MAAVRLCLCFFVMLVTCKLADAEPSGWCGYFCGDGDDSSDDDYYDIFDLFGICDICYSDSDSDKSSTTAAPEAQQPVKIMIPPANGLNLTVSSSPSGSVLMNLVPWAAPPPKPTAAAPAATTAAAAATTTAAPPTTAAATTKKA